jgi:hypothetical protein
LMQLKRGSRICTNRTNQHESEEELRIRIEPQSRQGAQRQEKENSSDLFFDLPHEWWTPRSAG